MTKRTPIKTAAATRVSIKHDIVDPAKVGNLRAPTESGTRVTVLIPKNFTLTLDDGIAVKYQAGIDEMPAEHANHWYSVSMGVEIYKGK